MALPGVTSRVVQDLAPGVLDALQGRTDVSNVTIARAVKRAIQEVTASHVFEELRVTGPQVQLTTGDPIYLASFFVNNGDDFTFIEDLSIFVDYPSNQTLDDIKYRTPKYMERMIAPTTTGIPTYFTRFGVNLHFGPTPNNPFTVYARYQLRHPFSEDNNALPGAPIYIPADWEEIIEYEAASRICLTKRWNEQYDQLHKILFGDPASAMPDGKLARPGLYAARLLQVERDQIFDSRSVGIVVSRYGAR